MVTRAVVVALCLSTVLSRVWAGRRWARIVAAICLVLFVQALARAVWKAPGAINLNFILATGAVVLCSAATILLFFPVSNRWFSTKR